METELVNTNKVFVLRAINKAVFFRNDKLYVISPINNNEPKEIDAKEAGFLYEYNDELQIIQKETIEQVRTKLIKERIYFSALHNTLAGLDDNLTRTTKEKTLAKAEEALVDEECYNFVITRLYGCPLPLQANIIEAINISKLLKLKKLNEVFETINQNSEKLISIRLFFNKAISKLDLINDHSKLTDAFISQGVFAKFFLAVVKRDSIEINKAVVNYSFDELLKSILGNRNTTMLATLKEQLEQKYKLETPDKEIAYEDDNSAKKEKRKIKDVKTLLDSYVEKIEKRFRKKKNRGNIEDKIKSQMERIFFSSQKGRLHEAKKIAREIISDNLEESNKTQLVKSLTNISTAFLKSNYFEEAEEYISLAESFNVNDPVVGCVRVEILKALGEYKEAMKAVNKIIEDYPNHVIARNTKVEILKALGKYKEAMEEVNKTIEEYPNNVVARTTRVEILKTLGEYKEAMEAVNKIIEDYPNNEVAKNIRIEIFKDFGEYKEAMEEVNKLIEEYPNDVVARNTRVEILKALGKYKEAMGEINKIIGDYPNNIVAKNIKVEVLKALGEHKEAMEEINKTIEEYPNNVVARTTRVEIFKDFGEYKEAMEEVNKLIEEYPNDVVARNTRVEILKALGKYKEAMEEVNKTIEEYPNNVVARTTRVEILKALGEYKEAMEAVNKIIEDYPNNEIAITIKAEILKRQGNYQEAFNVANNNLERFIFSKYLKVARLSIMSLLGILKESDFEIIDKTPKTENDFVEFHMLGMYYLRTQNFSKAIEIFQFGTDKAPVFWNKNYFLSGQCIAKIREKEYLDARKTLYSKAHGSLEAGFNRLLLAHCDAELGEMGRAEKLTCNFITEDYLFKNLKNNLAQRYNFKCAQKNGSELSKKMLDTKIAEIEDLILLAA